MQLVFDMCVWRYRHGGCSVCRVCWCVAYLPPSLSLSLLLLHTRCVRASTSWQRAGALSRRRTASRRRQTPSRWVPGVGRRENGFVGKKKKGKKKRNHVLRTSLKGLEGLSKRLHCDETLRATTAGSSHKVFPSGVGVSAGGRGCGGWRVWAWVIRAPPWVWGGLSAAQGIALCGWALTCQASKAGGAARP